MSKKKNRWITFAILYVIAIVLFMGYAFTSEERSELYSKMTAPISATMNDLYTMPYTIMVFVIFVAGNIYSYYNIGQSYLRQANRYRAYTTQSLDSNLKYMQLLFDNWADRNLRLHIRPMIPAIAGTLLMFLWMLFAPDTETLFDRITPSAEGSGWIITVLAGLLAGILLTLPTALCVRYLRYSGISAEYVVWTVYALIAIFDLMAAFLIIRTYSIWMLAATLMISLPLAFALWPATGFDHWKSEAEEYQQRLAHQQAEKERIMNCDIDYDSGGGGGGSSVLRDAERERQRERRRRDRELQERRAEERAERIRQARERARENATKYDCAHYRHGMGEEGCTNGGINGTVSGPCEYEMSPGTCPRFRKR